MWFFFQLSISNRWGILSFPKYFLHEIHFLTDGMKTICGELEIREPTAYSWSLVEAIFYEKIKREGNFKRNCEKKLFKSNQHKNYKLSW